MAIAVLLASPTTAFAEPSTRIATPSFETTPQDTSKAAQPARTLKTTRPVAAAKPAPAAEILSDSPEAARTWRQTGMASWYGGARWHGKLTSSGVRYDQNALTAAHATLPIGTKVRVQLEGSDRSVVVVINDRPGTRRRIIDLSRQAAAELGILSQGIAVVTLAAL
jgi:rare lipoprotein A (peptidoglycan hydrolase)